MAARALSAIVVGAGAYGLACAERLARHGVSVTVLERDEPANPWAASGGLTRVLRFEYGAEARYTELTLRARERWRELEAVSGERLFVDAGVLHLARGDGAWELASQQVVEAAGVPHELLDPAELARRWPGFSLADVSFGLYSPEGGYLYARRATGVLAGVAAAAGAHVRPGVKVVAVGDGEVELGDGSRMVCDLVVICTGAWSSGLDARLAAVVPRRQVTGYLAADVGPLPVWALGGLDVYGFPPHDGLGAKVGWHRTLDGPVGDPADPELRVPREDDLARLHELAVAALPALGDAPYTAADVCFYAMTPDEHPIIDRIGERTFACCGLSGHGFKFSCVLAPAAAELALGLEPSVDLRGFEVDRPALAARA